MVDKLSVQEELIPEALSRRRELVPFRRSPPANRRLPSIRTTSGHAIKLYRLPVSFRISQYPWPAQSCPVAPPRRRSLSAVARTCRRQGSGDHLVTAPPPSGSSQCRASTPPFRLGAGAPSRHRRQQLAVGQELPWPRPYFDPFNAIVADDLAAAPPVIDCGYMLAGYV
jgi:hypothetical protein